MTNKKIPRVSETNAAYADVRRVMDAALEHPGLQYRLPTPGKARNFTQRCNKFRANLRRAIADDLELSFRSGPAETIYDSLCVSCPKGSRTITISTRVLEGELLTADGEDLVLPEEVDATSNVTDLGLDTKC